MNSVSSNLNNVINFSKELQQDVSDIQSLIVEIHKNTTPQLELDLKDSPKGVELLKKVKHYNTGIQDRLFYTCDERVHLIDTLKDTIEKINGQNAEQRKLIDEALQLMNEVETLNKLTRQMANNIIYSRDNNSK